MTSYLWNLGTTADFDLNSSWQGGTGHPFGPGDTGTMAGVGSAFFIGELGDVVPDNVTFTFGVTAPTNVSPTQSNLSFTDEFVPAGFVANSTLPGGNYTGGTSGPVIESGYGIHGLVTYNGTINVGAGDAARMGIDASSRSPATGLFDNHGTINLIGSGTNEAYMSVVLGTQQGNSTAGAYANLGTVNINDGVMVVTAPDVGTSGTPTGTSNVNLSNTGYIRFGTDIHANTTINFQDGSNDRLALNPTSGNTGVNFGGQITNFQAGNKIALLDTAVPAGFTYNQATQTLNVTDALGGTIANLNIIGNYQTSDFQITQNLSPVPGFTSEYDISTTAAAICFTTGTLIRTARGDVAVEHLRVGDEAVTASGALRRIRWIGHRELKAPDYECWPVRIRAGAFGGGLPERDLFLSPGHPVLVGNGEAEVLVPIMCLINGTSIKRVPADSVTYWHVELESHDILLAEGLPAESFLDFGCRSWFEGADATALNDPDFVPPGLNGRCRPVAIDGPSVEAERRRIDALFAQDLVAQSHWPCDHLPPAWLA